MTNKLVALNLGIPVNSRYDRINQAVGAKYPTPHQGRKEILRRQKQAAKLEGKGNSDHGTTSLPDIQSSSGEAGTLPQDKQSNSA